MASRIMRAIPSTSPAIFIDNRVETSSKLETGPGFAIRFVPCLKRNLGIPLYFPSSRHKFKFTLTGHWRGRGPQHTSNHHIRITAISESPPHPTRIHHHIRVTATSESPRHPSHLRRRRFRAASTVCGFEWACGR